MKKSLFQANYYESRRLRHDGFIEYAVKEANSRRIYTKPFSITRKIFSILGVLIMFGLTVFAESSVRDPSPEAPVETWGINFFPLWLFFLSWGLWFILCRITLHKKYLAKIPYATTLNANGYILWLTLWLNLFFITIMGKTLTIVGLVLYYFLIAVILFFIGRARITSLRNRLYGTQDVLTLAKQRKLIQVMTGLGGLVVAVWMVVKFLIPQATEVRTDMLGVLSFIGMMFAGNVVMLGTMIVLLLPHSLYGYYRHKYAEDYREFEEKSLEEWYGKKYLKKYGS